MEKTILLATAFLAVSTLFSMIGLGGGILYVPILLFAGFSFDQAPAISLLLISATSLAAIVTFWRNKKVDWKLAMVIDPLTNIMAFTGGFFSSLIPEPVLQSILVGILMIAGTLMLSRKQKKTAHEFKKERWWLWHRNFHGTSYTVHLPLVLTATALVGLLSGTLGITGGIIKLPLMVLLCGVPMDVAVATSTIMVAATALSGLAGHAANGHVDWHTGFVLAIAAVIGGLLGSRVSVSMNKSKLKKGFGVMVWLIAIRFLVQLLHP